MFEKRKNQNDDEISLTQMDEDGDLKDEVWIQMNQLNLVVAKKATKEFVGGETKSALEERSQHHNFIGVRSGDIIIFGWPPLVDNTEGKKMIVDKFEELAFINGGWPEHLQKGGSHGDWSQGFGLGMDCESR
jgi:hypothetical protein